MKAIRKYSALLLLVIFSCYYSSINFFGHTHVINGVSKVHSHLGGNYSHTHTSSQFGTIEILSNFQSESAVDVTLAEAPVAFISDFFNDYREPTLVEHIQKALPLRGPPSFV